MKRCVYEILEFSEEFVICGITVDNGFYEVETCANVFSAAVRVEYCCSLSVGSPSSAIAALLNGISCRKYQ